MRKENLTRLGQRRGDAARVTWPCAPDRAPPGRRRNRSTAQTAAPGGLQGPSSHQLFADLENLKAGSIWGGGFPQNFE